MRGIDDPGRPADGVVYVVRCTDGRDIQRDYRATNKQTDVSKWLSCLTETNRTGSMELNHLAPCFGEERSIGMSIDQPPSSSESTTREISIRRYQAEFARLEDAFTFKTLGISDEIVPVKTTFSPRRHLRHASTSRIPPSSVVLGRPT
jgi:hypothetical protein